jgi:hypothetical protein
MAIARNKAQVPIRLSIVFLLLVLQSAHPLAASEKENSSNPSVSWSKGREADVRKGSDSMDSLEDDGDEFTGGFSTLDSMLQWAIGTSTHNSLNFSSSQFSFSFF